MFICFPLPLFVIFSILAEVVSLADSHSELKSPLVDIKAFQATVSKRQLLFQA